MIFYSSFKKMIVEIVCAIFLFLITILGPFYVTVPMHNLSLWRMERALASSISHPIDAKIIEQHSFLGTRYTNTSECTYAVGEFRLTSLPREVLLEKYKNLTVDIGGFSYNMPVNVVIVDNEASLPLDNPADAWLHDFLENLDLSSSNITYYLIYLYEEGRSSLGDYRCYE